MSAMVGGSSAAEVDDTIRGLVSDHKAKIEEAAGEQYGALEPIQATKQVVRRCGCAESQLWRP